eukprot:2573580-Rhodomonas_salina.4
MAESPRPPPRLSSPSSWQQHGQCQNRKTRSSIANISTGYRVASLNRIPHRSTVSSNSTPH